MGYYMACVSIDEKDWTLWERRNILGEDDYNYEDDEEVEDE
jgi:hypothetical protein